MAGTQFTTLQTANDQFRVQLASRDLAALDFCIQHEILIQYRSLPQR